MEAQVGLEVGNIVKQQQKKQEQKKKKDFRCDAVLKL